MADDNAPAIIPVGIDLGTSFCAISYVDADGCTQMIANECGEVLTPSVVYFDDEQISVGQSAWEAALRSPDRVAENVKRDVGSESYRHPIGGTNYPPEVIQSCLLRRLRQDIVGAVGESFQAVITVPAYFDEARRKSTWDAAIMSGLPVLDIVNEPTAAALAFGERLGYLTSEGLPSECLNVLVYDLGGGTFDVTVIRLTASEVRTLATDGDYELGGINWDQRLAEFAKGRLEALGVNVASWDQTDKIRLLRAALKAKHDLTVSPVAIMQFTEGDKLLKLPITREEFEDLTSDLLERTVFTTRQAMQAAGLIWKDIDRLLLVGGSSRMPAVLRTLKQTTGLSADATVSPDEAVARGASIFSQYLLGQRGLTSASPGLRITDVSSHSLGIEGVNLQTLRTENTTLIPRNTQLPCEINRTFVTRSDDQRSVKIQLLEGESSIPGQCAELATATIRNLPPGLPKGTPINVTYSLQPNGRLEVTAAIPRLGEDARIELQRVRGLADNRVRRWKRIVCRDGGFRDFQDALAYLVPDSESEIEVDDSEEKGNSSVTSNLEPAVNFGAPKAAAETLQTEYLARRKQQIAPHLDAGDEDHDWPSVAPASQAEDASSFGQTTRRRHQSSSAMQLFGYATSVLTSLVVAYLVLRWLRPDLIFEREPPAGGSTQQASP